jgi:hypothetical protein
MLFGKSFYQTATTIYKQTQARQTLVSGFFTFLRLLS